MARETGWFKSSYSGTADNGCVEVRIREDMVALRDSKNPAGPSFAVPRASWDGFLNGLKGFTAAR
ncbi:DUF397 domain-containing protein [Solihabitans fulvus]|uniref:DUF397 domain-containing protein n=1 Tax=Solihabitans fulvus TaxID=1892852 RepID=A0A5B2XJW0_9PSEU|nr:DUF397 domain-containing protein [Solihabitans fulvus]KAA2264077.1 DUF397 domain-containing protein [Solihabitans fulvus]